MHPCGQSTGERPRQAQIRDQMAFSMAATGKALTTTTFPNISRLPALVAGFTRVFSIATPGIVSLPFFLTSFAATSARAVRTFVQSDLFNSVESEIAWAISV